MLDFSREQANIFPYDNKSYLSNPRGKYPGGYQFITSAEMLKTREVTDEQYENVSQAGIIECHRNMDEVLRLNDFNLYVTLKRTQEFEGERIELYAINPCLCWSPTDNLKINNTHYNFNTEKDKRYIMKLPNKKGIIEFGIQMMVGRTINPVDFKSVGCYEAAMEVFKPKVYLTIKKPSEILFKHENMPYHFGKNEELTEEQLKENREFLTKFSKYITEYKFLIDMEQKYSSKKYLKEILADNPQLIRKKIKKYC